MLYSLSHFECDGHTVHMLPQWCALPPLTSTVKLSLFTPAHSCPLALAARYIDVLQTVLVILTMAGLFLDRPCHIHIMSFFQRLKEWRVCVHKDLRKMFNPWGALKWNNISPWNLAMFINILDVHFDTRIALLEYVYKYADAYLSAYLLKYWE